MVFDGTISKKARDVNSWEGVVGEVPVNNHAALKVNLEATSCGDLNVLKSRSSFL